MLSPGVGHQYIITVLPATQVNSPALYQSIVQKSLDNLDTFTNILLTYYINGSEEQDVAYTCATGKIHVNQRVTDKPYND